MNRINKMGALLLLAFLINGCASTNVKFTEESQVKIKNVIVDAVNLPDRPTYNGLLSHFATGLVGSTGGYAGGVVGGLAVAVEQDSIETDKSDSGKIKHFLKKNKIDIKQIFTKNLEQKIRNTALFKYSSVQKSDAKFEVSVSQYGLSKAGMSFTSLNFIMSATIKLIDNNNKIVWQEEVSMVRAGRESYEDWFSSPKHFEKSVTTAVNEIIEKWFDRLSQNDTNAPL